MTEQKDLFSAEDMQKFKHIQHVFKISDYPFMIEISQDEILKQWMNSKQFEHNDYDAVIERAEFFIKHGLTPAYYGNSFGTSIVMTSQEYVDGQFH